MNSNRKGAIAEAEIAAAAVRSGLGVYKPLAEHGRADLVIEIGGDVFRVQCKWASLDAAAGVVKVQLKTSSLTPAGYVRTAYTAEEVDLVAAYCGELDQCYLFPIRLVAGRSAIQLRLAPARNHQRACINLAREFEFCGAVAQLEERRHGMAEAEGSSPSSSTPSEASIVEVGAHEFRNHFGYYMERAAAGEEIRVSRHGRPFVRLTGVLPAQPTLLTAAPDTLAA